MERDLLIGLETSNQPHGLLIDYEQQYFTGIVDWIPSYEMRDGKLHIEDPVWGKEVIGDQPGDAVLIELANHPALRRLMAVEQLTLPRDYTTIPNTSLFSRWEHIWGSVVLARRLARQHELSDEDSLKLQLRTLLSDAGQTMGSHLGDWFSQGMGGPENQHDQELYTYLEVTGVNDILRAHKIKPEDVIFPKVKDLAECPLPALCMDRVDYGLREIRRWMPDSLSLVEIYSEDREPDFKVVDNQLVMTDREKALAFGDAFLELSREHWSEPAHRLQLVLYMQQVKHVIASEQSNYNWLGCHPRDILYCSDPEFSLAMREPDPYRHTLDTIMKDLAKYERGMGWRLRYQRIQERLISHDEAEKKSNAHQNYALHHPMLDIEPYVDGNKTEREGTISYVLPSLKLRQIDPSVLEHGNVTRLSDLDSNFKNRLNDHRREMAQWHVAHVAIGSSKLAEYIKKEAALTDRKWRGLMSRPRMQPDAIKQHIGSAAMCAAPLGFINYRTD